jgi:hypothetical protein
LTTTRESGKGTTKTSASTWSGRNGSNDANGFFSIGGLPPGKVVVRFIARDYCCPAPFQRSFGDQVTSETFVLARAAKATIKILDDQGTPIPNPVASVTHIDGTPARVDGRPVIGRGDAAGQLKIVKMPPGDYVALIRKPGFEAKEISFKVAEGEHFIAESTLQPIR